MRVIRKARLGAGLAATEFVHIFFPKQRRIVQVCTERIYRTLLVVRVVLVGRCFVLIGKPKNHVTGRFKNCSEWSQR